MRDPWENPALSDAEAVALMPPDLRKRAEALVREIERVRRGDYYVAIETKLIASRGA